MRWCISMSFPPSLSHRREAKESPACMSTWESWTNPLSVAAILCHTWTNCSLTCEGQLYFLPLTLPLQITPFGLTSALLAFQKMMSTILARLPGVQADLDGIICYGITQQDHKAILQRVLHAFNEAGLKLNMGKFKFNQASLSFLGHTISKDVLHPDKDRACAVAHAPAPYDTGSLNDCSLLLDFLVLHHGTVSLFLILLLFLNHYVPRSKTPLTWSSAGLLRLSPVLLNLKDWYWRVLLWHYMTLCCLLKWTLMRLTMSWEPYSLRPTQTTWRELLPLHSGCFPLLNESTLQSNVKHLHVFGQ